MDKYVTADLSRMQLKLVMNCFDDMSLLTKFVVSLPSVHIWKMVPLGVYRWTHALYIYKENDSLGSLQIDTRSEGKPPCLVHSVCVALHGIGLWDLQS